MNSLAFVRHARALSGGAIVRRLILLSSLLLPAPLVHAQVYRFEAEEGLLEGTQIASSTPGYSGTGYVNFNLGDSVTMQVDVPDGLYELWVGYNSPFGPKEYQIQVDQEIGNGNFNNSGSLFLEDRAGLFRLSGNTNSLQVHRGWGWYNVDYIELRPGSARLPITVPPQLSDAAAGSSAQFLMDYLASIYGSTTLSGQQGLVGQETVFPSPAYLAKSHGLTPALRGSDFMDYSPSRIERGANPNGESERVRDWAAEHGGVVTMMWHWNAPTDLVDSAEWPWWRGFYTQATYFDLPGALANREGEDFQLILRDIDAIASELQKFDDAGIPVLWRPLHEAQGGWFWWGAHGAEAFVELWNVMYDRLTHVHDLHNLIWVVTSSAADEGHLDWYPGDDVVDIVGIDIYTDPSSSMSGQWYDLLDAYDGRKMIALSETGHPPDPDLMRDRQVRWCWFSPWEVSTVVGELTDLELQSLLGDPDILTLDELPFMPWRTTSPADFDHDGDVDGDDFLAWQTGFGTPSGASPADGDADGDGDVDGDDFLIWQTLFSSPAPGANARGVPEPTAGLLFLLGALAAATVVARLSEPCMPSTPTAACGSRSPPKANDRSQQPV